MPGTDVLGELLVLITGDTKGYDKNIDASKKKTEKFEASLKKFGDTATKKLTLPLAAVAAISTKLASDLGESINAVNVVYGDSAAIIKDWGDNAAEQAGLSKAAFNESSALIGTLLKKTGQDLDGVANNTITLTKRTADLASVFNKDLSVATTAVGAALRGETEPIRAFAIDVSAAAVESEALTSGLIKNKSELTEAVKVQARYNLILKQSQNVAGDFTNTNNELANSSRVLKADLENAAAELGQNFLPIAKDFVSFARDLVKDFNELDEGTKKIIVGVAGIAAAAGPATNTILGLNKAFKLLSSPKGGIGLALIAITSIVAGIKLIEEANLKESEKNFDSLATTTGKTAKELNKINLEFANLVFQGESLAKSEERVQEQFGITKEELVGILAISKDLYDEDLQYYKELDQRINGSNTRRKEAKTVIEDTTEAVKTLTAAQLKQYTDQNDSVQEIIQGSKTEIELIDEQIAQINKLSLADGKFKDDQTKATELLQAKKKAIIDQEIADNKEKEEKILSDALRADEERLDKAQKQAELVQKIKEDFAEKQQKLRDEEAKAEKEKYDSIVESASLATQTILSLANSILQSSITNGQEQIRIANETLASRIEALNTETLAETELSDFKKQLSEQALKDDILETKAKIEQLIATGDEDKIQEAKKLQIRLDNDERLRTLQDQALADQKKREDDISEAKKETALKVYKIELESFKAARTFALAEIAFNTATAVAKVWGQTGLGGLIAQAAPIGMGIAQAALVLSKPEPTRPQLNTGAIVAGSNRGVAVTVGENNQGEIIQGMGPRGAALRRQLANETADVLMSRMGSTGQTIVNNFNGITKPSRRDLEQFAIWLRNPLVKANQRVGA